MKCLLITGFFLLVQTSFSQTKNGHIQYAIEVMAIDTSLETHQAVGLLQNSSMELFLAEDKSRVDFNLGDLYSTSIIIDYLTSQMLMLYSGVNGRSATVQTIDDELGAAASDTNTVVIFLSDTKRILNYNCKKAITRLNGQETVFWYTDEISISAKGQSVMNPYIPGFPMAFSTMMDGVLMEYEVSLFEKDVIQSDDLFSTEVPDGYPLQR